MPPTSHPRALGALVAAATLVGGGGGLVLAESAADAAATTRLHLTANPKGKLRFTTSRLSAKAGTVTIAMRNPKTSGKAHGIAVEGNGVDKDGRIVKAGGTSTLTVKLKRGSYSFYCPVPAHKKAGMTGKLTVG
jgi:uncharacterized cupredoxin-like copper-binding protein